MTSSKSATLADAKKASPRKQRLPKGSKIRTRPIKRPPPSSSYMGADEENVVYVSARSSFVGVVKRVGKIFIRIHKQNMAEVKLIEGKDTDKQKLESLASAAAATKDQKSQVVLLKATNRAIDKALGVALYLREQGDLLVQLKTGTVAVVDDIILKKMLENAAKGEKEPEGSEEELETRVRHLSMLEVSIRTK